MRLEIIERDAPKGPYLTLVNMYTRKHVATIASFDNYFTSNRIKEATDLYQDLMDHGLLIPVLQALEKRKKGMQPEQQKP